MQTAETAVEGGSMTPKLPDLSKLGSRTLEALCRHPVAHNLEWVDVVALLSSLGTVEQKSNNETSIRIGTEHQLLRRPHGKDLTLDEVMVLRHFLKRAGLPIEVPVDPSTTSTDFLVTIDHHEAKVYRMDLRADDPANHEIKPYDPHHFLHHLSHKDQSPERGQRAAEDPTFYERIAQALAAAVPHGRIVLLGHGKGHSDAAHHLMEWLRLHHRETFQRLVCATSADLSSLTPRQLLDLGRTALAT
ncbi:hypothetical protein [Lichenifustis flavocetrariae]|uniref:Uncharacterized protein n=1 Tax=Lichenifustis flavocetrariae TaxID=2949735 RepID=A0AA42CN58_9HYPH|nr:hypothetical protein [Lichenifustis flavocetrariae]MCW6512376.1 hypothetical protein [Lichenifustis flavocetrariae]